MAKKKPKKKALEGGTAHFWGDDIDSEVDEKWFKAATTLLNKKSKLKDVIDLLKDE